MTSPMEIYQSIKSIKSKLMNSISFRICIINGVKTIDLYHRKFLDSIKYVITTTGDRDEEMNTLNNAVLIFLRACISIIIF